MSYSVTPDDLAALPAEVSLHPGNQSHPPVKLNLAVFKKEYAKFGTFSCWLTSL